MSVVQHPRANDPDLALSNPEGEQALLGALLIDNELLASLNGLTAQHFASVLHGRIYAEIAKDIAAGRTANPVTLRARFESDADIRALGGTSYLARLTADGGGLLAVRDLAEQICDLAARRATKAYHLAGLDACSDLSQPLAPSPPPETYSPRQSLPLLDLVALSEAEPEPKHFIIPKIAPAGEVTLFTGAGAVGKSLLTQQGCSALALGARFLGFKLEAASAIYITCEDDADQLHWRQAHICKALGISIRSLAGRLHLASLRGQPDNALAIPGPDGRLMPAPLYHRTRALIAKTGAKLVCFDNVAHLFTGNENDRGDVTLFINLLNRLAGETGAAILLLAHPNKGGDTYSGSTAWLNAVRSQVFMARLDGDTADPDARTLSVGKPNYTQAGEVIRFRWRDWAFVMDEDLPASELAEIDQAIREREDEQVFLACLQERTRQRRAVSEKTSPTFAPTVFAKLPESKRIGAARLESAMDRLFRQGEIERAFLWNGPDRKPVFGLRATAEILAGNGAGNTLRETQETAR